MKTKIIDAKCPYCKTQFTTSTFGSNWATNLWGEYASSQTTYICPNCKRESIVTLTCTYKYNAKKAKTQKK